MSIYETLVHEGRSATERYVRVERRGDRALVTLDEPERLNVLSAPLVAQAKEVVAPDELLAVADAWSDRIAALPPHALAMAKPLLRAAADSSWDASLAMEEFAEPNCFTTAPFQEAVRSMRGR